MLDLHRGRGLGVAASGYAIHHGRVEIGSGEAFPGGVRSGAVAGTMWHGSLEGDAFREAWLGLAAEAAGTSYAPAGVRFAERRAVRLDLLGDLVEEHLDVDALLGLARRGAPAGLPVLPPGDRR